MPIPKYLYNIQCGLNTDDILIPHVPYSAADDEDQITERICLAPSIEQCLQAINPYGRDLRKGCIITVRIVNTSVLNPKKFKSPDVLFYSGKVPDALWNQEWWYLDEIKTKLMFLKINDYVAEYAINWTVITSGQIMTILDDIAPQVVHEIPDHIQAPDDIFFHVQNLLYTKGQYLLAEQVEDAVTALPWAQTFHVHDLTTKQICNITEPQYGVLPVYGI